MVRSYGGTADGVNRALRRYAVGRLDIHGNAGPLLGALLDRVVVLGEAHSRRLLREYVDYYNAERVHTAISDAPMGRASETRPSSGAQVVGLPHVGGLHHRYTWQDAA